VWSEWLKTSLYDDSQEQTQKFVAGHAQKWNAKTPAMHLFVEIRRLSGAIYTKFWKFSRVKSIQLSTLRCIHVFIQIPIIYSIATWLGIYFKSHNSSLLLAIQIVYNATIVNFVSASSFSHLSLSAFFIIFSELLFISLQS
jgi:hypothetical protein